MSAEEQAQLSALAASRSLPHAMVARAKLVLWAAQGESNPAIAERLSWSMPTVGKWRADEQFHASNSACRNLRKWRLSGGEGGIRTLGIV